MSRLTNLYTSDVRDCHVLAANAFTVEQLSANLIQHQGTFLSSERLYAASSLSLQGNLVLANLVANSWTFLANGNMTTLLTSAGVTTPLMNANAVTFQSPNIETLVVTANTLLSSIQFSSGNGHSIQGTAAQLSFLCNSTVVAQFTNGGGMHLPTQPYRALTGTATQSLANGAPTVLTGVWQQVTGSPTAIGWDGNVFTLRYPGVYLATLSIHWPSPAPIIGYIGLYRDAPTDIIASQSCIGNTDEQYTSVQFILHTSGENTPLGALAYTGSGAVTVGGPLFNLFQVSQLC